MHLIVSTESKWPVCWRHKDMSSSIHLTSIGTSQSNTDSSDARAQNFHQVFNWFLQQNHPLEPQLFGCVPKPTLQLRTCNALSRHFRLRPRHQFLSVVFIKSSWYNVLLRCRRCALRTRRFRQVFRLFNICSNIARPSLLVSSEQQQGHG